MYQNDISWLRVKHPAATEYQCDIFVQKVAHILDDYIHFSEKQARELALCLMVDARQI